MKDSCCGYWIAFLILVLLELLISNDFHTVSLVPRGLIKYKDNQYCNFLRETHSIMHLPLSSFWALWSVGLGIYNLFISQRKWAQALQACPIHMGRQARLEICLWKVWVFVCLLSLFHCFKNAAIPIHRNLEWIPFFDSFLCSLSYINGTKV
jgi:hypothetical protein